MEDELDPAIIAFERQHVSARNAEVLAGVPRKVIDLIVSCDHRYAGHNADGTVLLRDTETGTEETVTVDEYLCRYEIDYAEVFYTTVDVFLGDVKSTTIVPTGDVVDVLLDLRRIFYKHREEKKKAARALADAYRAMSGVKG